MKKIIVYDLDTSAFGKVDLKPKSFLETTGSPIISTLNPKGNMKRFFKKLLKKITK